VIVSAHWAESSEIPRSTAIVGISGAPSVETTETVAQAKTSAASRRRDDIRRQARRTLSGRCERIRKPL
jgi:hypothetical protein